MFQLLKYLLVTAVAVAPFVQAYTNPLSCTGHCFAHDPAVAKRSDGTYFKFNTGNGIEIAKATSLHGPWTLVGEVLPGGTSINGQVDLWAPDVSLVNGVYHLYYAVSSFGSQNSQIGLATSTTMEPGSWKDLGATGVSSNSTKIYNAIDPNLILVGSTYYLNFGSFWDDIYQVPLNSVATKASGTAAYNLEFNGTDATHACEGSFMFYCSGYYYLLWSHGICCGYQNTKPAAGQEYMIMMARSKTATGGFVDKNGVAATASGGSVLLQSHGVVYGPGGQGVLRDPALGLVLYYHYADTNVGLADGQYLFGFNVLTWSNGWPVV